ncbi:hypothetical protein QI212_02105 [Staphylococcus saprophyticus]|nr:hypothetical protein [Staphylococcus saprophyticus]
MEKVITYLVHLIVLIVVFGIGLVLTGLLMLGIQSIFSLLI